MGIIGVVFEESKVDSGIYDTSMKARRLARDRCIAMLDRWLNQDEFEAGEWHRLSEGVEANNIRQLVCMMASFDHDLAE